MAAEEEATEAKSAIGKNVSATPDLTVNNSAIDTENNINIDGIPQSETLSQSTMENAENNLGDNQYFFEDEIFHINKAGRVKFGLVIETCDSYSGDEDEDDEEEKLNRGDVRVAWYPHGREHVRSENTIGLADRTLMPGDVVRRMTTGCSPQRGYVRDIKIFADVKILGTPYVIKNVCAERLRPLSIWQRDCTVCLDSWVGSAKDVDERAILKGVNGVRFEIQSADFYHFKEVATSRRPSVFSPLIFFPGNIVIGRLPWIDKAKVLTADIPLPLNRKGVMLKGKFVVESVRTEGVIVQWQCKALCKGSSKTIVELEPPKPYVSADQLDRVKRLNVFESCVLQIADRSFLTFEQKDQLMSKVKWEKELAARFKEIFRQQQKTRAENKKPKQTKIVKSAPSKTGDSNKLNYKSPQKNSTDEKSATPNKIPTEKDSINTTDGEWLDTTTTTSGETSDQSDADSDEAEDRDDLDSVATTGDDEETAETENCQGSAGASLKKSAVCKNITKKSTGTRNKHSSHNKQKNHSVKLLQKNSFSMPLNNLCSAREGRELITETLLVYSTVSVVWQDGLIEHDIPSTELYPIHHLDNHEFFPGDFTMLSREDPEITFRDYGVIQTVDHQGRTARVKWFKTYTSKDEPNAPTFKGDSEVSVYDLKDHPDFTYRPGGMVIRVSNFVGDDATCTAGQVLDNCIDGRVKVAWVDSHISSCWPQDLFDVGHHEHNDYIGDSDSWETQSENSGSGGDDEEDEEETNDETRCAECDIVVNVERTRSAIARLEDILKASPHLQSRNVMQKLLSIYKTGRYIDRLLQTSFFHEDRFLGLIKCVSQEDTNNKTTSPDTHESTFNESQTSQEIELNITEDELTNLVMNVPKVEQQEELKRLFDNVVHKSELATVTINNVDTTDGGINQDPKSEQNCTENANSETTSSLPNANNSEIPVLLNVGFRIPNNSGNLDANLANKTTNNGNSLTTSIRTKRNYTYNTNIVHVQNDDNSVPVCGRESSKNPYTEVSASQLEKVAESDEPHYDSLTIITPSAGYQLDNSSVEKNRLLLSALISIEKAYQVTNSIKSNVEALLSQDDSGTFSRSNSDIGAAADSDNLPEDNTEDTHHSKSSSAKKIKSSTDFDVVCQIEFTEQVPSRLVCVPFCSMLKDQLQKCKEEIERQCNRFTTYKPLAVPTGNIKDSIESANLLSDSKNTKDDSPKAQTEKLTTVENNQSKTSSVQEMQLENSTYQADETVEGNLEAWVVPDECFKILPHAPKEHKFYISACEPSQPQQYFRAIQREHRLLKTSLPKGIWLRFYEDRIDLLSVMMEGPKKTPYENGVFFFDMQLGRDYPKRPPVCHYISYCVDRLNPNLYEEGKVCVSLLGTWSGRDVEVWGSNSTLLQVLVSIQGLILVPEPYFNEAGYEKQKGSLQGLENSRMYNEMVVIKVTQATTKMLSNPPSIFSTEIQEYYKQYGLIMYKRIEGWMELSKDKHKQDIIEKDANQTESKEHHKTGEAFNEYARPDFPLLPASRGFCLTLEAMLKNFKDKMESIGNSNTNVTNDNTTQDPSKERIETVQSETGNTEKDSSLS